MRNFMIFKKYSRNLTKFLEKSLAAIMHPRQATQRPGWPGNVLNFHSPDVCGAPVCWDHRKTNNSRILEIQEIWQIQISWKIDGFAPESGFLRILPTTFKDIQPPAGHDVPPGLGKRSFAHFHSRKVRQGHFGANEILEISWNFLKFLENHHL